MLSGVSFQLALTGGKKLQEAASWKLTPLKPEFSDRSSKPPLMQAFIRHKIFLNEVGAVARR